MKAVIARSEVRGSVPAVPSKSHAHRLLIAAALSPAPCKLVCPVTSRDIDATVRCLNALGARIGLVIFEGRITDGKSPLEKKICIGADFRDMVL